MADCRCADGWVCARHPDRPHGHDGCDGAGEACETPGCLAWADADPIARAWESGGQTARDWSVRPVRILGHSAAAYVKVRAIEGHLALGAIASVELAGRWQAARVVEALAGEEGTALLWLELLPKP